MNDKQFGSALVKAMTAVGKGFTAVQQLIDAALEYAIERQNEGHGADFRRLSAIATAAITAKGINSQRMQDYIKVCVVDINGAPAIGWNQKDSTFKLLVKGTVVSVPSFATRGTWFDYGKPEAPKDDFSFSKALEQAIKKAEKADTEGKLTPADHALLAAVRSARLQTALDTPASA
jgi:hypothetical protein